MSKYKIDKNKNNAYTKCLGPAKDSIENANLTSDHLHLTYEIDQINNWIQKRLTWFKLHFI